MKKISAEAKDLISKLLIKNPTQRITCTQAMKHSWFDPIREEQEQQAQDTEAKDEFVDVQQSIHDIKVYSEQNIGDDDDDDDDDGSNPVTLIKQTSIRDIDY